MQRNEKVWAYSSTGTRVHAFVQQHATGTDHLRALCRGNIARHKTAIFKEFSEFGLICPNCMTKFMDGVNRYEASMEPATEAHDLGHVVVRTEPETSPEKSKDDRPQPEETKELPARVQNFVTYAKKYGHVVGLASGTSLLGDPQIIAVVQDDNRLGFRLVWTQRPESPAGWAQTYISYRRGPDRPWLPGMTVSNVREYLKNNPKTTPAESMREFSRVLAGETKENDDMGRRKTTGPLSPTQHRIMHLLVQGREHAQIAKEVCLSRTMVSEHVRSVVAKMGVSNSAAAVGRYAKWEILGELIRHLENGLIPAPDGEAEEHVNDCYLRDIARMKRTRAELVP